MDRAAAKAWIHAHVEPVGVLEMAHQRPWATVLRVPLADALPGSRRAAQYRHSSRGSRPRCPRAGPTESPRSGVTTRSGFRALCGELAAHQVPETVQHDDLHMANVYTHGERLRLLDWGDTSIAHPFASLVVTFRFLEERNRLAPGDPWFARLRDAYLEPWGGGLAGVFALAIRVGTLAHTFAWARQRDYLPEAARPEFDRSFAVILRRAVARSLQ